MSHVETECTNRWLFGELPLSSKVRVEFGAHCAPGKRHSINGDHHVIARLGRSQETLLTSLPPDVIGDRYDEYGYGMVVADGIGTAAESEAAARIAISTLLRLLLYFGKWNLRIDSDEIEHEIRMRADRFFRHVDVALTRESANGPIPNLQTSMTSVFGAGEHVFFAHVGHSRAYLFRDGALTRLTRDHTIAARRRSASARAALVDVTVMTRDLTHILEQTIGMAGSHGPRVDVGTFRLENNDMLLLCTNGVTDAVDEAGITDVLSVEHPVEEYCRTLVARAMEASGVDDATALAARYHIPA